MYRQRAPQWLGLMFFGIGGLLLLSSLSIGFWMWNWASRAERTDGEVVRLVHSSMRNAKGRTTHGTKPVVSYAVDGKLIEVTGYVSSSPPAYRVGDKVQILYDKNSPTIASIDSFMERWFVCTLLGLIGAVFSMIGAGMFVSRMIQAT